MSRRVLVLRAAGDERALAEALAARGFEPVLLPLIAFEPGCTAAALRRRVESTNAAWIVLTSPRAARAVAAAVPLPAEVRLATVGAATTRVLTEAGLRADFEGPGGGAGPMLEAWFASATEGTSPVTLLWARGDRALPHVREALAHTGHRLEEQVVYRTLDREVGFEEWSVATRGVVAACFTSPSTVASFAETARRHDSPVLKERILAAALGASARDALVEHGFTRVVTAARTGMPALADAVARGLPTA